MYILVNLLLQLERRKKNNLLSEEISRIQLLSYFFTTTIFFEKKKILGNNLSTIATEHWWLNNILHFVFRACTERRNLSWHGAMLFWRLTFKAKNILSIQRDKVRTDRATTHGMLGL